MAQDSVRNETTSTRFGNDASDWLTGWRLDALVTVLSVLIIAGVAWDFRVHAAGISFAEEGFFTESHVFFYSMFLVLSGTIILATVQNHKNGRPGIAAIPRGYALGIVGVGLFAVAGGGDFIWHSTFGFEEGIEGLTSPTHLLLGAGAVLFLGSPLRATRRRPREERGSVIPALISGALVLTVLALFTAWANPIMQLYILGPPEFLVMAHALASIVLFTVVLIGGALVLWRDLELPFGSVTLVFLVVGLASAVVNAHLFLLPGIFAAGLVGDGILWWSNASMAEPTGIRLFAVVVPVVLFAAYLLLVQWRFRMLTWTIEVLGGALVLSGVAGLLVSYLSVPSAAARSAFQQE